MRFALTLIYLLGAAAALGADRAADVARIHLEAIGGPTRIAAVSALRLTGQGFAAGKQVRFTMTAARPARVRLETENEGRTLVQATDGVDPAWEFDTGSWPPQYRPMADTVAKTFVADAEFDDPLVAGEARGYILEYAGELEVEGRKLFRLLVTHKLRDTFSLLVDDVTYMIVMRVEHRTSTGGRKLQVVTHYEDFRPVAGLLLPHQVTVVVEGRVSQQTKILKIEANPAIERDFFTRPKVAVPSLAKP